MISECNIIWVDSSISVVHKYQFGTEVFRHRTAVPWLLGVSEPPALLLRDWPWAEPGAGNRLLCHFNSSSSTQKLTRRPRLPVFPRLNIHSLMKKRELENCVTVPSGDTWHPDLPLGKGCGSAGRCFPQDLGLGTEKRLCPPKLASLSGFCTPLRVTLIKGPNFSSNFPSCTEIHPHWSTSLRVLA